MTTQLEDFFTLYPDSSEGRFNLNDLKMLNDLKELIHIKDLPIIGGGHLTIYQTIVSRLLSGYTKFDSMLICHEMGTGKTCTAIATIELHLKQKNYGLKGAIIITKGNPLINNFQYELIHKCTPKGLYKKGKPTEVGQRNFKDFYKFYTYVTFVSAIKDKGQAYITERFDNRVIVIDEAHNVRLGPSKAYTPTIDVYNEIHKCLHTLKNKKILLLTGTPMKDTVDEIAPLMNLILPLDRQMPVGAAFNETFLEGNDEQDLINIPMFKDYLYGYVSFLKASKHTTSLKIIEEGSRIGNLKHFKVVPLLMSEFQTKHYLKALSLKINDIYNNEKQASLFVFPNGTYGTNGFAHYVESKRLDFLPRNSSNEEKLILLKNYSVKYHTVIKSLLEQSALGLNSFVFCEAVKGSGLILFASLLEQFGFSKWSAGGHGLKYAILTNETSTEKDINTIIRVYNKSDNKAGKMISVILGSKVISEGFTLRNTYNIHILTPHWNYTQTSQIIARALRIDSHDARDRPSPIRIWKYVALPTARESIDLLMYETSEKKDILISKVMRTLREAAIDCFLFKPQNKRDSSDDGTRDCEYRTCSYICDTFDGSLSIPAKNDINYQNLYVDNNANNKEIFNHFTKDFKMDLSRKRLRELMPTLYNICFLEQPIKNKYGIDCYLKEVGDIFYLTETSTQERQDLSYYTQYFNTEGPYESAFDNFKDKVLPAILRSILKPPITEEQLFILPDETLQTILEIILISRVPLQRISKDILDILSDNWKQIKTGGQLLTIIYGLKKEKCLVSGTDNWRNCKKSELALILTKAETHTVDRKYSYYGLKNSKVKQGQDIEFCIRPNIDSDLNDRRKIQSGKRCFNWQKNELISVILNLPYEYTTLPSVENATTIVNGQRYLRELFVAEKHAAHRLSNDALMQRLGYWGLVSKNKICDNLMSWFDSKGILFEDRSCGNQLKKK